MPNFIEKSTSPFFMLPLNTTHTPALHLPEAQGVGIFIINLDECTQRLSHTLSQLSCLNYPIHRISAERGPPHPDTSPFIDQKAHQRIQGKTMGPGTAGCSFSHIKAWNTFLSSSYAFALICEDDMTYGASFPQIVNTLTQENAPFWDVCSFQVNHQGAPLTLTKGPLYRQVIYLFPVTGAGCYLLTRIGAHKLLSKALPLTLPIDHYFTRGWEFPITFIGIEPRCVAQEASISSEIDKSGRQARPPRSFTRTLVRILYVGAKHVMHFMYNGWTYLRYQLNKRS